MRLLLIDPYVPAGGNLNTSLGWLSAAVHKAGHEVFVLDLNCRRISNYGEVLPEIIRRYSPNMIGITVMCTTYVPMLRIVDHLNDYYKGYIAVGGAQIAFEEENALRDGPRIDFAVIGDAEETAVELLDCLEKKGDLSKIEGLIYRENGRIKSNPHRKWWEMDLNKLPFPDFRLFGLKKVPPGYSYRVSTSRGCPFRCVFCNPITMQSKWRSRNFDLTIEELRFARAEFGVHRFNICEPVFNLTKERVIEFCDKLLKEELNMSWTSSSGLRARPLDDEMVKIMKKSGYYDLKIGVETLSPDDFPFVNKGESLDDIIQALEVAKRNGLRIEGSFIIGLPGSTYKTVMDSFKRAQEVGFDEMGWSLLIPYPGTQAYDWVQEHGTMYYNYKEAHQYLGEAVGNEQLRVAFDTPEFPMKDRIKAIEQISWKLKQAGLGNKNYSILRKAGLTVYNLARYDPWNIGANLNYIVQGIASEFKRRTRKLEDSQFVYKNLEDIV